MLVLTDVRKSFDGICALNDVSLTVENGETLVLLGTSGCGKSTVLKMILGLLKPDSGAIFFQGRQVTPELYPFIRGKAGYVIQNGGLFPHMSARANVEIMARYLKWPQQRLAERVSELASLVKIDENLLSKLPAQMSGGQCQRIGLMRALMLDPDVLLLDEPLGALDPITRHDLQSELRDIFNSLGKTVILVTHDLPEAHYFADKIALMNRGRVVQYGTMADLLHRPADDFVTRFVKAQRPVELV